MFAESSGKKKATLGTIVLHVSYMYFFLVIPFYCLQRHQAVTDWGQGSFATGRLEVLL